METALYLIIYLFIDSNSIYQTPTVCQTVLGTRGTALNKTNFLSLWSLHSSGERQTINM